MDVEDYIANIEDCTSLSEIDRAMKEFALYPAELEEVLQFLYICRSNKNKKIVAPSKPVVKIKTILVKPVIGKDYWLTMTGEKYYVN